MEVSAHIEGLTELFAQLDAVPVKGKAAVRRALYRISHTVLKTAREYAPISPTVAMMKRFLAAGGKEGTVLHTQATGKRASQRVVLTHHYASKLSIWKKQKRPPKLLSNAQLGLLSAINPRAALSAMHKQNPKNGRRISRPVPGGLMRALTARSDDNMAEISVPVNSEAGKYGYVIHEEKGIRWKDRGPGTQAKGAQADAKFIARAITDNKATIKSTIKDEYKKAVGVDLQS